ncbi:MAG: glycosyltransferase family 2 protein [Acidobacteriia bacterium]|nr:glycosyltransferase family 2 protein [Terriglobia bacterium]
MLTTFYVLAILVVIQGVVSASEGVRYHRYILSTPRRERVEGPPPRVTVIVPCKGDEHELVENLDAVLRQDSPAFETIFVTASADDPAQAVFEELRIKFPWQTIKSVVAGTSDQRGEKVNNLLEALDRSDPSSEVFVFADSDAQPPPFWLGELVAPLHDPESAAGASTGYRWYLPERQNPPSVLRSAWNAGIVTLLGPHDNNFCWGGSMAIRRETFERARVRDYWQHSISDDYSLTQALRDARLSIHFVPQCLLPSRGRTTWREVTEWSTRQLILTRIYWNKLWKLAAISQTVFSLVFLTATALLPREWRLFSSTKNSAPAFFSWIAQLPVTSLLFTIFVLGFIRGLFRWLSVRVILSDHRENLNHFAWAYIFLPPVISLFSAYILWRSAMTRLVAWRGKVYELVSSREVKVLQ